MVITHQPQLIITDTGIPIVDILTNVLFKEQNEPSTNMVLLKNLDDMVVVEDAYRAKIQSRFSRKQSLKRKIFILYFRLLFSRRTTLFPLVPPVTNHPVYIVHVRIFYRQTFYTLSRFWNKYRAISHCLLTRKASLPSLS